MVLGKLLGDGISAEEHMVTRLGVEPRTPGLKVPHDNSAAERDQE